MAKGKLFFGDNPEQRRKSILLFTLLLTGVGCLCAVIAALALWTGATPPALAPDYAPRQTEANMETIGGEPEKLDQPEGGGAVSLTYSREVAVSLSEKTASLLFANPPQSNQDMLLQLVIQDVVVLQTDRIPPGNQLTVLDLLPDVTLSEGIYEGKFIVTCYQQASGEKAMVNTEIPVQITVAQ